MRKYTGMYILKPTLTEEQIKSLVAELNDIFTTRGGEILSEEEWGLKDLAYEINDFAKGYYVKFAVNANNEAVAEYDRICNIKEDVIRHILVRD
jgi:small subunit ribosomal protein S6